MIEERPRKIAKYKVLEILGQGAMGVVFLCYDSFIDRKVAIKVTYISTLENNESDNKWFKVRRDGCVVFEENLDESMHDNHQVRLFFNEVRIAGNLKHPNIVPIHDAGIEHGNCYLVMEYIKGGSTLKEHCTSENLLPAEKVLEIIFRCLNALEYAHSKGVVHRDIKPSNIMLTEDMNVKICDFGIAQLTKTEETQLIGTMGSPLYMSPEQVLEEDVTNQSDLFSLGVVMYELLTGNTPFTGKNVAAICFKIVNDAPQKLSETRPELPTIFEEIIEKALSKKLTNRYKNAKEFAGDINHAFNNLKHYEADLEDEKKFNQLKNLKFFKEFEPSEIREIIHASSWLTLNPGSNIITKGDLDNSFYIIVSGDVEVVDGDKVFGRLSKGECFGEVGYLTKAERTASIVSVNDVQLLKVVGKLIDNTSVNCQLRFNKVFLNNLLTRLAK